MKSPHLTPLDAAARSMLFARVGDDPPTLLTQEHRTALVAGWAAGRSGLFGGEPPLLARFDAHLDFGERPRDWAGEIGRLTTLESVMAEANAQREDDGGWAMTAMQWGLAGDMATFFVDAAHRFPLDNAPFDDFRGGRHRLWTYGSLAEWLDDPAPRAAALREALATRPLWLDIDLDFATICDDDQPDPPRPTPWGEAEWKAAFPDPARELLLDWTRRARLITLATEPEFCGGLAHVGQIAHGLRQHFPEPRWNL